MEAVNVQHTEEGNAKSVKLERTHIKKLGKLVKSSNSLVDAARKIGIKRQVLGQVLLKGSASPATIKKIKSAIAA